jgi:DNA-binding transcriptional ArsR family regulator
MKRSKEDIMRVSSVFRALSSPVRVRILLLIDETKRPLHIKALADALKMDYAAVYRHVKILQVNRLVKVYEVGRSRVISLKNFELLNQIMEIAKKI